MARLRSSLILLFLSLPPCFSSEAPPEAHLSPNNWHLCEQFIKKEAAQFFSQGITYIHPLPNHPYPIEQDPETGRIYIHLKGEKKSLLGEGGFKQVTKSILYGKRPKLVARCRGGRTLIKEAEILCKLQGTPGIVQLKSFIQHQHKKSDLILEYYNAGSLRNIQKRKLKIPEKELLPILRDLIIGLRSLHAAGYIHRDLHRGNILFNRKNGRLHAALTDFGLALKIKENPNSRISVQDTVCAPEVLLMHTRFINRKKAEAYSLGAQFYYIIFKERPAWWKVIVQFDLDRFSVSQKIKMYKTIQSLYKKTITHPKKIAGIRKDLARMTFKLLNPDPKKRMYLGTALKKINSIATKWRLKEDLI